MEEIQVDFEMLRQQRRKYLEYFSRDGLSSPGEASSVPDSPVSSANQ